MKYDHWGRPWSIPTDIVAAPATQLVLYPGKWWFGDPCYLFGHRPHGEKGLETWQELCRHVHYGVSGYQITLLGRTMLVGCTKHGDGWYTTPSGIVGVDAGMLAMAPYELVLLQAPNDLGEHYADGVGVSLEISVPTVVTLENYQWMFYDKLWCDTAGDDDEEDNDE